MWDVEFRPFQATAAVFSPLPHILTKTILAKLRYFVYCTHTNSLLWKLLYCNALHGFQDQTQTDTLCTAKTRGEKSLASDPTHCAPAASHSVISFLLYSIVEIAHIGCCSLKGCCKDHSKSTYGILTKITDLHHKCTTLTMNSRYLLLNIRHAVSVPKDIWC